MEFIDQKTQSTLLNSKSTREKTPTTTHNSKHVGFLNTDATEYPEPTTHHNMKHIGEGYLVCDKCNGYYKLHAGESPEDFTNKCECGGKLEYRDSI
jgi:hypothetical protein